MKINKILFFKEIKYILPLFLSVLIGMLLLVIIDVDIFTFVPYHYRGVFYVYTVLFISMVIQWFFLKKVFK